jgi:hypothetical protein
MDNPKSIEGGCFCGATRYRATDNPYKLAYCYCRWCCGVTGAPVVAWTMFDRGQLEFIKGNPQKYASSPGVTRSFCSSCGTPLSWEGAWDDRPTQMVTTASLDDPEPFQPDRHASCHNKISWFEVDDDFPRHEHGSPCP